VAVLINKHLDETIGDLPEPTINTDFYDQAFQNLKLPVALKGVWQEIRNLNVYLQEQKPWEKVSTDRTGFEHIIRQTVANLLLIANLLTPFLPDSAQKIKATFADGKVHSDIGLLFPKK
jgi:methionyl-tRNA synthetase